MLNDDSPFTTAQLAELAQQLDPTSRVLHSWPLTGGVSAQVAALELERTSAPNLRVVLRRHGLADRMRNPQIAQDELRLLEVLHGGGLPVPAPLHVEPASPRFPVPVLVVAYCDGSTDDRPADWVDLLATTLAHIHQFDLTHTTLAFLPNQTDEVTARLQQALQHSDSAVRALAQQIMHNWPPQPAARNCLLHGDFWPGNLLWQNGRLSAILDWEDAALGNPLADLANTRLELLWAAGQESIEQFTDRYLAQHPIPISDLPVWELVAALRPVQAMHSWGLEATTELRMHQQLEWFMQHARMRLR